MSILVSLNDHAFHIAPVEMWHEVFTDWAALYGRVDEESADQLAEYEEFLRASIRHLKQLRDASLRRSSDERERRNAEIILMGIFGHVARSIAFAERKIAGGKMPRGNETAVLGREELVRVLDDDVALLDEAIKRHQ